MAPLPGHIFVSQACVALQVSLVIDAALLQHVIRLGAVGPVDLPQGSSSFHFKVRRSQNLRPGLCRCACVPVPSPIGSEFFRGWDHGAASESG